MTPHPDTHRKKWIGRFVLLICLLLSHEVALGQLESSNELGSADGNISTWLEDFDRFGSALEWLEDFDESVDNPSYEIFAVGAPGDDDGGADRGALWLLYVDKISRDIIRQKKISSLAGRFNGQLDDLDRFGSALSSADLDRDGVRDLIVGAPGDDDGCTENPVNGSVEDCNQGAVWVLYMNGDGTVRAHTKFSGRTPELEGRIKDGDQFGAAAFVWDLDEPGAEYRYAMFVGAPQNDDAGRESGALWHIGLREDNSIVFAEQIDGDTGILNGRLTDFTLFGSSIEILGPVNPAAPDVINIAVAAPHDQQFVNERGSVWVLGLQNFRDLTSAVEIRGDSVGTYTRFGTSLEYLEDIDGDMILELAIGATSEAGDGSEIGTLEIVFIGTNGLPKFDAGTWTVDTAGLLPTEKVVTFKQQAINERASFGEAAVMTYLDNDDVPELLVGAPRDDGEEGGSQDRGAVWMGTLRTDAPFFTGDKKISATSADGFLVSLQDEDHFGFSTASAHINNDNVLDLIVGAPGDDTGGFQDGAVWILLYTENGMVSDTLRINPVSAGINGIIDPNSQFGYAVASLGNLDGLGGADIVVSSPFHGDGGVLKGALWVLFLNADGTLNRYQQISDTAGDFAGEINDLDLFGFSLLDLSRYDVNGNNVDPKLAVGARDADEGGAVWILSLKNDGSGTVDTYEKITGNQFGESDAVFGGSLAAIGDLDGNFVRELVVGAWGDDDGGVDRGAVWVLFMDANDEVIRSQKISDTEGEFTGILDDIDFFGTAVASLGDIDVDGVSDIAVGAPSSPDRPAQSGAVWLLFLNRDGTVREYQEISSTAGNFTGALDPVDYFGASLLSFGNLDNDGFRDLLVGAWGDDDGGINQGALHIVDIPRNLFDDTRKVSDVEASTDTAIENDDRFGASVAVLADLDNDGRREIAIGAPGDESNSGAVYILFSDETGGVRRSTKVQEPFGASGNEFGTSIALPDSLDMSFASTCRADADGTKDLIVGTKGNGISDFPLPPGEAGGFWLLNLDEEGQLISSFDCLFFIEAQDIVEDTSASKRVQDELFGVSVASLGDIDGNEVGSSVGTLVVGTPRDTDGGGAWILFIRPRSDAVSPAVRIGPDKLLDDTGMPLADGIDPGDQFGYAVAKIGNLDNDEFGVADFVVGSPGYEDEALGGTNKGAVWIIFMNPDGSVKGHQKISDGKGGLGAVLTDDDRFGSAVGSDGDLNGDGIPDIAVGAPGDDESAPNSGAVWTLFMNRDGTVARFKKIKDPKSVPGEEIGGAMGELVDLDGDGVKDLVVGTSLRDTIPGSPPPTGAISVARTFIFNDPPVIESSDVRTITPSPEQEIEVEARITDNKNVIGTLHFRRSGDEKFLSINMDDPDNDSNFEAAIPAFAVSDRGVDYFIQAEDEGGETERMPEESYFSISMFIPEPGLRLREELPAGKGGDAYRLISFPIAFQDTVGNAVSILEDDMGGYNDTKWRFFEASTGAEFSESMTIEPGEAYWVVSKESGKFIDSGAGVTVPTEKPFKRALDEGWNYFGNPFNFPLPRTQACLASGDSVRVNVFTDTSWVSLDPSDPIEPMDGYIVWKWPENTPDTLIINPDLANDICSSSLPVTTAESSKKETESWAFRISATTGSAYDVDNVIGLDPAAANGWDGYDRPEPPVVWDYVSVYFKGRDGMRAYDYRSSTNQSWDLEVVTNTGEPVELSFSDLDAVPDHYSIWLVDEILNYTQNLRESDIYTLVGGSLEKPRQVQILVATDAELADGLLSTEIPDEYALYQNFPNPFSASTTIKYGLPEPADVTLIVYDMLGRQVVTLESGAERSAGYHSVVWDGRSQAGVPMASGAYFLRIQTKTYTKTTKMVLVR